MTLAQLIALDESGEVIAARMAAIGLSDRALARSIGVTRQAVWRWRTGRQHPRRDVIYTLADALSVTPGALPPAVTRAAAGDPDGAGDALLAGAAQPPTR